MLRLLCLSIIVLIAAPARAQDSDLLSRLREALSVHAIEIGASTARMRGSGHITEELRAADSFVALQIEGPIDVELRPSTQQKISVRFDDNLQQMLLVKVLPGPVPTLTISLAPGAALVADRAPKVIVEFVALNDLTLRGSGDVHVSTWRAERAAISINGSGDLLIDALDVPMLAVAITGSGDFSVAGRADQQAYSIQGSGDVRAEKLIGRIVKLNVSGSGDAEVNATQTLEVAIAGSGDVRYAGKPRVTRNISGTGTVAQLEQR